MNILMLSAGTYLRKNFSRNFSLARELVKLGARVTLVMCSRHMRFEKHELDGVHVVCMPEVISARLRGGGLGVMDTVSRLIYLLPKKFDIVHTDIGFRPAAGWVGHLYARLRGVPRVSEWWDWIGFGGLLDGRSRLYQCTLGASDHFFEVYDKKIADGVVAISHCLHDRALEAGIPAERVTIIRGGAEVWTTDYLSVDAVRARFGVDPKAFIVGFVGMGPFEHRDLCPFLEAGAALRDRIPNFKWFSTGDALPQPVRERYQVGDEYEDFGWVDFNEFGPRLAIADVFILLLRESLASRARWPNKLGDYLAAGRPVVATAVGEVGRFMAEYPGGFCPVSWQAEEVADALTMLAHDRSRCEQMGRGNLETAVREVSWGAKATQLYEFYHKIKRLSGK